MSSSPDSPTPITDLPAESARAMSELNNLLQIISGTSSLIESGEVPEGEAKEYMSMLRASIERAEKVAHDLSVQAGGTVKKMAINPDFASGIRVKKEADSGAQKQAIMIVDDEQMALSLMKRVLSEAGYNVVTAQSGFECLDQFRRRPFMFQLVLLDLTMPFMDGEETFRRLREIRDDVPVLLCTGFIQEDRLKRLIGAGLTGFLRKPISPNEITGVVRSTLQSVRYANADVHGVQDVKVV